MLSLDEVIIARSMVKQFGDISKYAVQCQNNTLRTYDCALLPFCVHKCKYVGWCLLCLLVLEQASVSLKVYE